MAQNSRSNILMLVSTVSVSLLLLFILVFAIFTPPSPEKVVSEMLTIVARQQHEDLEDYATGVALTGLLEASQQQNRHSHWFNYWDKGEELFTDIRIGQAEINGDTAVVTVYYGPGQFQMDDFLLRKVDRRWRVYDVR